MVQAYKWSLVASRNGGTGNFGKAVQSYLETIPSKLQPRQVEDATMQAKEWMAHHSIRPFSAL